MQFVRLDYRADADEIDTHRTFRCDTSGYSLRFLWGGIRKYVNYC